MAVLKAPLHVIDVHCVLRKVALPNFRNFVVLLLCSYYYYIVVLVVGTTYRCLARTLNIRFSLNSNKFALH